MIVISSGLERRFTNLFEELQGGLYLRGGNLPSIEERPPHLSSTTLENDEVLFLFYFV